MRYTMAERELLDGMSARNAAAASSLARDRAYADAYYAAPAAAESRYPDPGFTYAFAEFSESGRIRCSLVRRDDIAAQRRAAHENWVYPRPDPESRGFVFTHISAWGGQGPLERVERGEYIRRYRYWCLRYGAHRWHPVMVRDRRVIEAQLRSNLPRAHWVWRLLGLA